MPKWGGAGEADLPIKRPVSGADVTEVGQSPPDERTRKVSWDMVRRSAKPRPDERPLHVSTKCTSIDDLIQRFAPFATQDGLTVPAREALNVGDMTRVRLTLADGLEVLSARGQVVHVRPPSAGASDTRCVVRLKLLEMDEASQLLFMRLCEHQNDPVPAMPWADAEKTFVPDGRDETPSWRPSRPPPPPPSASLARVTTKVPSPPALQSSPVRKPTPPPPARGLTPAPAAAPRGPTPAADAIPSSSPASEAAARVAGSHYKLPANPLAELGPEAVRSFVDLGLYEAPGDAPPWDEDDNSRRADRAAPGLLEGAWKEEDLDGGRGGEVGGWRATRRWVNRLPLPLRRTLMQAIPFAFCTMLGWCVGFNMARVAPPTSRGPGAATTKNPTPAGTPLQPTQEIEVAESPPLQPEPVGATSAPEPSEGAELPTEPPAAGGLGKPEPATTCLARVQTRPDDVVVTWGDTVLGKTPLAQAVVPCGPAEVTLERERYDSVKRKVEVAPGVVLQLDAKLQRPAARLTVTSSPAGATVMLNGRPVGKTPRALAVSRFESVKVDIRLPGHRSWHTNVYLKDPQNTLDAKLDALPPAAGKKK